MPDQNSTSSSNNPNDSEEKEEKEKPTRRFRVKTNDGVDEDDSSDDTENVIKSTAKASQSKASGALVFSSKSVADGSADLESSKSTSVIYDSSKEILPVKYSGDTATAEIDGGDRSGAAGYNNNAQIALPEHAKNKLGKGSTMAIGPMKAPSFLRATSRFVRHHYIILQPHFTTHLPIICRITNRTFAKTTKKQDFVATEIIASSCTIEEIIRVVGRWRGSIDSSIRI